MPLIQCLSGPTTTTVGNENYVFARDGHGRAVCKIPNLRHVAILVGLELYKEAAELGPALLDASDPEALAILEARCNDLVIALGKAEAELADTQQQLANSNADVADLRRQLNAIAASVPAGGAAASDPAAMLLGSDAQPSIIEIGDTGWALGDIVALAHDDSGLSVDVWNALTQPEREARIAAAIEVMRSPPAADQLQNISGIGAAAEKKLIAAGVTTFKQIAELSPDALAALDESLGLKGISARSGWQDQAKALVAAAASASSDDKKGG